MKNIFTYIPCKLKQSVQKYYQVSLRAYHDWDHILDLTQKAKAHGVVLQPAQELAILFHDSIYVPGSTLNEKMSAQLMRAMTGHLYSDSMLNVAEAIIIDTASHIPSVLGSDIVSDLDLLVLADMEEFEDSHSQVYDEFKYLVPIYEDFIHARRDWAKKFLERDKIYHSKTFSKYEEAARTNLKQFTERK